MPYKAQGTCDGEVDARGDDTGDDKGKVVIGESNKGQ